MDDVRAAREFLRDALRALGYDPAVADSADEAFRVAEQLAPNLVLVDLHMPEVDGWAAARGLRARMREHTFLVALSADVLADNTPRLREAGFDGFSKKPLDMRELQALLVRAHEHCLRHKSDAGREAAIDRSRWEELRAIEVGSGRTLLDRMRERVAEDLPEAVARAERATDSGELEALARALHDIHGLLSLIGASRACSVAQRCEAKFDGGRGRLEEGLWRALLESVREVLARL